MKLTRTQLEHLLADTDDREATLAVLWDLAVENGWTGGAEVIQLELHEIRMPHRALHLGYTAHADPPGYLGVSATLHVKADQLDAVQRLHRSPVRIVLDDS